MEDNFEEKVLSQIDFESLKCLDGDEYELAVVLAIYLETAKYFYRDEIFFLFKENIDARKEQYNFLNKNINFNINCKSFCTILIHIINSKFPINMELTSTSSDEFAHQDILITTKSHNKYIINPLMDLVEAKVGKRLVFFASKRSANIYRNKYPDIKYLDDDVLNRISSLCNYPKEGQYFDEKINVLHEKNYSFEDFLNFLLQNKGYINGIVDLKIYIINELKHFFHNEEILVDDFVLNKKDNLEFPIKLDYSNNDRKRGLIIFYQDYYYLFPVSNKFLKFSQGEWQELSQKYNIVLKRQPYVRVLDTLKQMRLDRNIIHNRKFLEIMNYYEKRALNNQVDIMNYLKIEKNRITILYDCNITLEIINGDLNVIDNNSKIIKVYHYINENDVKVTSNMVSKEEETDNFESYLLKSDILGIFTIDSCNDEVKKYLTPYNEKFLSRNTGFYYESTSLIELFKRRKNLIELFLKANLTLDEKYVVLENILNISSKVYYLNCLNSFSNSSKQVLQVNYQVLLNDSANFINFLRGQNISQFLDMQYFECEFSAEKILENKRQVELDNKLYIIKYLTALKDILSSIDKNSTTIITPGYGSIYLGPFAKVICDLDYSTFIYSKYKKVDIPFIDDCSDFSKQLIQYEQTKENIVILDDNVGTGSTLEEIKNILRNQNYNVIYSGGVQYTYDRLQDYIIKERGITVFDPLQMDLLTPHNYPRHHIIEGAVKKLFLSADEYLNYLKQFGYGFNNISDYDRILLDALFYYYRYRNIGLLNDKELKTSSQKLINSIIDDNTRKRLKGKINEL